MSFLIGIDGGGTRTTLAVADEAGRELARRIGPAGLVDPRRPEAAAEMLVALAREAVAGAGLSGAAEALCAGLAGVGSPAEREVVVGALQRSGIARRVRVISDGETALAGAFAGGPGILLVAGTGSIAFAQAPGGRVARCGGWGMVVGDEGSGFAIGRAALAAALRAVDGRGAPTRLLPALVDLLSLPAPEAIPPWAGRAEKSDVAGLAIHVFRLAEEGDSVARGIVEGAAGELAEHAAALAVRLRPWPGPLPVVLHGGVGRNPLFAAAVERALARHPHPFELREPRADAVAGALQIALRG